MYVTVFDGPTLLPVLLMHTAARGKRRMALIRARRSAAVSHSLPSLGRYDMITPNGSPARLAHMNVHSRTVDTNCCSSSGVNAHSVRSS